MTSSGTCGVDKSGSATNEGAVTNGGNDNESLATLDSRRRVDSITLVFVDSKGLSSDGRLIDLEICVFCNDTTIGGNDGTLELLAVVRHGVICDCFATYLLDLKDITRNNHGCFDFGKLPITKNNGL